MASIATRFPDGYPLWRKVFAYAIYPVAFGSCLVSVWASMQGGLEPVWAAALASLLAVAFVVVAERIQPHASEWSRSRGDVGTDAIHVVVSQILVPKLSELAVRLPLLAAATALTGGMGSALWPSGLAVWLQLYLAVLIYDLAGYAWHRLCHEHPWFWRFHATHHSAERLYWLNAGRFHPIDTFVSHVLSLIPLMLLGVPAEILALATVWVAAHGLFQHSNVELRLGPLNYVFSMAELHRWHHSPDLRDQNKNYGNNVILWDLLFGTFHFPKDRSHRPEDVGFAGVESFPKTYLGQLASPFVSDPVPAGMAEGVTPAPDGWRLRLPRT